MNIQDKIGREQAKKFLKDFEQVHENIPVRVEIFMNTTTYKFLNNSQKNKRDKASAKVLFPMELKTLLATEIINKEEHDIYMGMLESEHDGDFAILEASINLLRNKRLKLKR